MMAFVGEAITQWSFVEQTLSNIFTVCVVPCPTRPEAPDGGYVSFIDSAVPTAVFYSVESFRAKLGLVDAALLSRIKSSGNWADQLRSDWARLKDKTRKLALKRNSLAHGTVTPAFDDGEEFHESKLMPPFGSPNWWAETGSVPPGRTKSPEQMKHLIRAFAIMDGKLRCFYKNLAQPACQIFIKEYVFKIGITFSRSDL